MTSNIPTIHPLPGTIVDPRRPIIMPEHPTYDDWTAALRLLAEAAEAGEPCPVLICPWDDGAPLAPNQQEG